MFSDPIPTALLANAFTVGLASTMRLLCWAPYIRGVALPAAEVSCAATSSALACASTKELSPLAEGRWVELRFGVDAPWTGVPADEPAEGTEGLEVEKMAATSFSSWTLLL